MSTYIAPHYKEYLKEVFKSTRQDRDFILKKHKHRLDPIRQNGSRYNINPPKLNKLKEEYNKHMIQKPERVHKKNVKVVTTDVLNTIPSNKGMHKQMMKSNRLLYRDQLEKNSKKKKPTGIKTFNSAKIENPYISIADIIHTEPSIQEDYRLTLKEGKKVYEHDDTFKKLFSIDRAKSVELPFSKSNTFHKNNIHIHKEKYPLMKSDHINALFERQKMYNDEHKDNDIAVKPNHISFKLLQQSAKENRTKLKTPY